MILNGNQRGGAKNLALHLMKEENERVEVHEIRGFVADDLLGAFQESHVISRATQCKQHMYSLSLNPPQSADVSTETFERAINQVEKRLGLDHQPRVIVFHEKRGLDGKLRRHAHAVWCRIDTGKMKAVQLSFSHKKLREVSRQLFVTHGWSMPDGLQNSSNRDPRNFTLAEWQQAKRAGKNAKELKALFQDCWALSDSKTAFASALLEQGFVLAQGKRGHVAVDYQGEVYPISRWTGLKAKAVRERLGVIDGLPSVERAQAVAAKIVTDRLAVLKAEEQQAVATKRKNGHIRTNRYQARQARAAAGLRTDHAKRQASEDAIRRARIRKGVLGFVDRLTGKRKRTIAGNAAEAIAMQGRDQFEMEGLEDKHHCDLQQ
ncbi:MAG: relaxase/mobilization nuclease domain-containing protein, partial [Cohaesibacteraceae bacterium]|nr:relaxase/mobilization nuclease domain-containing protein [Cohaesibacteraceae bacterium]